MQSSPAADRGPLGGGQIPPGDACARCYKISARNLQLSLKVSLLSTDSVFSESPLQTFKIMTSSLSVEWYSVNLSPKCQRIHRENRRGKTLRRRQRPEALQIKAMPDKELSTTSKRPAPVSSEAPQKKRTKISWP